MSDLDLIKQIEQRIGKSLEMYKPDVLINTPDNGYALNAQQQLIGLNLDKCNLDDISFLSRFTQLRQLSLRGNKVTGLAPLQVLKGLKTLNLAYNLITEIATLKKLKKLNFLDLTHNQITDLSKDILDFHLNIRWEYRDHSGIYLQGNPLNSPPPEIIKQGNAAIKAYFNSLQPTNIATVSYTLEGITGSDSYEKTNPAKKLNELKILLVGDGGAGKTSLSKLLRDQMFDPNESQTHGINIDDWKVNDITAHLWDFGGQEIMRATHKFFLSKRSLYVLVLDNREERDEERWLKRIESFGGNSPILIVLNKCEQNASYDVSRNELVRRYSGLQTQDFYRVSCAKNRGINAFKQGLIAAFKRVDLIDSVLPESWFQVKTMLEKQQRQEHYISYDKYIEICSQQQINDTETQNILARLLHDLGVCVHFEELALLDTHVLEPKWITEGVYKIITSPQLIASQGVLYETDLKQLLRKQAQDDYVYPPTKYNYLLELMKKFELSYRLNKKSVLIPQLLTPEEPDFTFDGNGQVLRFQILYDYLDDSIMPRFIVALHQDIDNRIQWRKGVLLHNPDFHSKAVVRVNYQDRLLTIVVNGERKRDYFAVIRKALHDIHASFEWKKPPVELVPLPDNPDYTVEYEELIGYELAGKDEYFVGKLRKAYSVSELLSGIEERPESVSSQQVNINFNILSNIFSNIFSRNSSKKEVNIMKINPKNGSYQAQTWEKVIVYLTGFLFVGAIVFLAIRNVPIADKNISVMLRIILSSVVAVFGAVIPGMLNVSWKGQGFLIRASGALALFVIAFFGTPTVF